MGKILAIDYGEKKIGLAISDAEQQFAFHHQVVENKNRKYVLQKIVAICDQEEVEEVVVGLPISLAGQEKIMASIAREFVIELTEVLALPISLEDERMTSALSQKQLAGSPQANKKNQIQMESARILLEDVLKRRRL